MIVYNPGARYYGSGGRTDRYELYSTMADTDPRHLRGLFSTFFAAWVALTHTQANTMKAK